MWVTSFFFGGFSEEPELVLTTFVQLLTQLFGAGSDVWRRGIVENRPCDLALSRDHLGLKFEGSVSSIRVVRGEDGKS